MKKIALAGNPNTGKSTLFNALTGMKQHTGNWPGKTVMHAEGTFKHQNEEFLLVDLPGTYSLFSNSTDEEVARDHIIFDQPDVTMVVLDATSLERNLNLALQVLEITDKVIICINLIDEADKKGIIINEKRMSNVLGVPVMKISARNKKGFDQLLNTLSLMVKGQIKTSPYRMKYSDEVEQKIDHLELKVNEVFGSCYPSRWIALRLLDGDENLFNRLKQEWQKTKKGVKFDEYSVSVHS